VVVVLDTLRPDHLGFHGYPRETAPFLSRLARTSALFPEALSTTTWTAPATASLVTGVYPTRHGVLSGLRFHRKGLAAADSAIRLHRIPSGMETLAEILHGAGYRTYGVASNVNIGAELGFDRGFGRFQRLHNVKAEDETAPGDSTATWMSAEARAALDQLEVWGEDIRAPGPVFLYLHLNDVHRPYRIHPAWYRADANPERAAYDSEIGYVDHWLRRIWQAFDLGDDTIVLFVSDHGEAFGERGYTGHSRALDPEVQRILFFLRGPGIRPSIHRERVSLVDVLPTILELTGLPPRETAGVSLAPILRADDPDGETRTRLAERAVFGHKETFLERMPDFWSVHRGPWKAKLTVDGWSLYDTVADPAERIDLSRERKEVLADLQRQAEEFAAAESTATSDTVRVDLDAEDVEVLRSLGYAD
jgi:arylsulfatase A-like enzyme